MMSWELMRTDKNPCPCGKGFIIEKHYMDDWNRTKEEHILKCKECMEEQIKSRKQITDKSNECKKVVTYFNDNYLEQWIEYFKNRKSKKLIWGTVHEMGMEICSLSTFYSRYRTLSLSEMNGYYKSLVQIQNIPKLIQVLNIKDEIIENALPELLKFYEEQERKRLNEAYAYYRKKI